jgi:hypothetical protein
MDKCFRKTSSGVWDSFLRFDFSTFQKQLLKEGSLNIVGVGGGPASDVMGSVSYLIDYCVEKKIDKMPVFKTTVLDYSDKMWAQTSQNIVSEVANSSIKQFSKSTATKTWKSSTANDPQGHFTLDFDHIDFTSVDSINKPEIKTVLSEANVVTVCWALNEAEMVLDFWRVFFKLTSQAIVIFIDGKGDKLRELKGLLDTEFVE